MRWKHLIVSLLVTLMVLQAGRLVHELARKPAARFTPMATGAQPRSLGMVDAMGNGQRELRLDGARLTVLVAFRSTCRYCDRALPAWKALARIVGQRTLTSPSSPYRTSLPRWPQLGYVTAD
jgi:hypothetical protein